MLFSSYGFLLVFLPATLVAYYLVGPSRRPRASIMVLVAASLAFYGLWRLPDLAILLASICFNFVLGNQLADHSRPLARRRLMLGLGLGVDLGVLGYFKYANFLLDTLAPLVGAHGALDVIMPLGISFFTFQKIAFLVDSFRGKSRRYEFLYFLWFTTFFPQLIAGPIVHHSHMAPQYLGRRVTSPWRSHLAVGAAIFILGLAKKVLLADTGASFATPVFAAAAQGKSLGAVEAWAGALAYTMQIYFDFSGYSDMAVGLARMFGFKLPVNFASPYKSASIVEFWRRWHITLSAFLRDYVYFPLGGNRKGPARRMVNLMLVMLVGGLWHGPAWTFVAWGGLHGCYLAINHAWRGVRSGPAGRGETLAGTVLTFVSVVVAWVLFRADSWAAAGLVLKGMAGLGGAGVTQAGIFHVADVAAPHLFLPWLLAAAAIVWGAPNTSQLLARYRPALSERGLVDAPSRLRIRLSPGWAVGLGILLAVGLMGLSRPSEFIYWMF